MKKLMRSLLAALLCVSAAHATTHTNHTFLMPRPVLRNMALESTTWHKQINKKNLGHAKFGGSIQLTGFYSASTNTSKLGQYFGFKDTSTNTVEDDIQVGIGSSADLLNNDILHNANASHVTGGAANIANSTQFAGELELRPQQNVWGARFDYYQDLEKLLHGLFFKVSTVVANVENELDPTLESSTPLAASSEPSDGLNGVANPFVFPTGADASNIGKTIADFFAGNLSQTTNPNITDALAFAKVTDGHDRTELGDIQIMLGYNLVLKDDKHVGLNLAFVIPTANKPKGVYLFEPIVGQGQNWAFGGGFDTAFTLWKSKSGKCTLELLAAMDYRFVFENTQHRTLGLLHQDGTVSTHSWYLLLGKQGQQNLFPAANVTTMPVEVTPGSQVDGILSLALNCSNWVFDLGYNLYAQEAEDVSIKSWAENTYGVANFFYSTAKVGGFAVNTADVFFAGSQAPITASQLDTTAASTPSQVTHKLYGGFGYAFNDWSCPLLLGAGASYEWPDNNAALEQWAIWWKLGLSF